ncbi:unnamed protein product [Orchesella dallaii]|uniref:Pericentrin/AKAP-450 centrosomal targeting domain-containing protein n=1 Tax=Orchesella dallaii TaxID=48710 RepID=A0ABP1Q3A4_9HEXA
MDEIEQLSNATDSLAVNMNASRKLSFGECDESLKDEGSLGLSDEDLDDFFKNAEHLSDQTLGDMRHYDCSITTDGGKSISQVFQDSSKADFNDLSCSHLVDGEKSLSVSKANLEQLVEHMSTELRSKNTLIKKLCTALQNACESQEVEADKAKDITSQISWVKENFGEITNLSMCSFDCENDDRQHDNFRLSSYIKAISAAQVDETAGLSTEQVQHVVECRSSQTSPMLYSDAQCNLDAKYDKQTLKSLCESVLKTVTSFKGEILEVRGLIKQPFENHEDFPIQKIMHGLKEIVHRHEEELTSVKQHLAAEVKHHQEVQSSLKDEIKTIKMRFQDKLKQKEHEVAELKARVVEDNDLNENLTERSLNIEALNASSAVLDDSFGSHADEETFSNLTRTKVEYLKLTPSEYVDDEVIDTVHIPDSYRQLLEDYKLKLFDMEKKFDSNKRYLEEQTHDREVEREEFQQTLVSLQNQIEEVKKENGRLFEVNKQHVYQIEEYAGRLKNAEEDELELIQKQEKTENELKTTVEKIFELREIIRDLEKQVDSLSESTNHLKEQNRELLAELDKQEVLSKKEQPICSEQDTYGTIPMDVTDEIQAQLQDLAKKIEFKISEMDNFTWQTRPNSSCSGAASAVSTEDISCRELAGRTSRNFENFPVEDVGSMLLNEIRRLESQFESLTRLEDVVLKKLKDTELRCSGQKVRLEELENQIIIYQEKCSGQMLKIADLEGQIDSLRFESSNQGVISSLKFRLSAVSKQVEEYKSLVMDKENEISKVNAEITAIKVKGLQRKIETRSSSTQTNAMVDENIHFAELTFDGVSPEKIRKMDTLNQISTSVLSLPRNVAHENNVISAYDPELSPYKSSEEEGRGGLNVSQPGGGDRFSSASNEDYPDSPKALTIEEMEKIFNELQSELVAKDKLIKQLQVTNGGIGCGGGTEGECEQECVTLDTVLDCSGDARRNSSDRAPKGSKLDFSKPHTQGSSDMDDSVYEICVASDYAADGDLLKYIGTRILSQGERRGTMQDPGPGRIKETEKQIEVATLGTQIQQLKKLLDEERKQSEDLRQRLKSCEEAKAEMRSRSPSVRAPSQNTASTSSVYKSQQKELVRQIEEGREMLNLKIRDIRNLNDRVSDLESKLRAALAHDQETTSRLNSTVALLKRCEEHGRDLTASNQEYHKENRRLRGQLDKVNINNVPQSVENYQVSGIDYFDNFLRAKSHKKALAWQKKYLSSVILGYKSIFRQISHGHEHPELVQMQVPLAPGAAGLLDSRRAITIFRVGALAVIAIIRMKYMVNRWHKKRPGESSPDSEYKASRNSGTSARIEAGIIRPSRNILTRNRINYSSVPVPVETSVNDPNSVQVESVEDISDYINRFESIEHQISSSLSRSRFPS